MGRDQQELVLGDLCADEFRARSFMSVVADLAGGALVKRLSALVLGSSVAAAPRARISGVVHAAFPASSPMLRKRQPTPALS